MKFIQSTSFSCANYLANQLKENHEKRRVYYFGFQIVVGAIVKGALLVGLALALGILTPTLAVVLVFAALRPVAGGYHMDTYGRCIAVSLAMFLLSGLLVQHTYSYLNTWQLVFLIALVFITAMAVSLKYAPSDTPNRPITQPEEIRKFKMRTVAYIIAWFVISMVLVFLKFNMFVEAGCIGVLLEMFAITPAGYRFFDAVKGKMGGSKSVTH